MSEPTDKQRPELDLGGVLGGKRFVVFGGTGFLGKVWCAMILSRFPEVQKLYLVVRPKDGLGVQERFSSKVLTSEVFAPLREQLGEEFDDWIASKVTPIEGDVTEPLCGTRPEIRDEMRGNIAAVVNVAGVVDFSPPLDEALEVNAFGCQNLIALSQDLGSCPVLHTSTCFVAGSRTGPIEERDPREVPFPKAGELDLSSWDPDREIAECLDVIEQVRHRASDAFRQTRFLDEARANLKERAEPDRGQVLSSELTKVKRRFVEKQLADLGMERANFWGWPNTYTYTKSLGEQIVARSGVPFAIVRPAIVESTCEFPFPGWNEGINTSAPFIFLIRQGGLQMPGSGNNLDLIPCDMVCGGIILALAELVEGNARPVYQAAASDRNPCTMARFFELSGLHKRRLYQETGKGGPLVSEIQQRFETAMLSKKEYEAFGPRKLAKGASLLSRAVKAVGVGPLSAVAKPTASGLKQFAAQQQKLAHIMDSFLPFTAQYHYVFKTDAVYSAYDRLGEADQQRIVWGPDKIDWRQWFLEVHAPALERHVFPDMEERLKKKVSAPRPHETLTQMLFSMADRQGLKTALCYLQTEGVSRLSYRELRRCALGTAGRLRLLGIKKNDRVLLCAKNHPAWPAAFLGVLCAGATVVPLSSAIDASSAQAIARASGAKLLLADEPGLSKLVDALGLTAMHVHDCLDAGDDAEPERGFEEVDGADLAALIYTSGTTGEPKGVMLSHGNLTAMVASLAPLFPLGEGDRLLSVLPLHHTFELSCGLLLPLSRGATIYYLDEVNADRLATGLKQARATALVGVPALWETLERRVHSRVAERGTFVEMAFGWAVELSRLVGQSTGLDVGRSLFGSVHAEMGGELKYLVSGGAALRGATHEFFQGLGLHLSEGYGLTEAGPVLTVARGGPRARSGNVGAAIPGVEIRIDSPDERGVGEVLARGDNVMQGYEGGSPSAERVIDEEGFLHTGDLGKLDEKGRLALSGRSKDVVVTSSGENVYPDEVESRLGHFEGVDELAVFGRLDEAGREHLACILVIAQRQDETLAQKEDRAERCREMVEAAIEGLPAMQRPAAVFVSFEPLPLTAIRKVRRAALPAVLQRLESSAAKVSQAPTSGDQAEAWVRTAVARLARRKEAEVMASMNLRADLGFDSLMALELLTDLEKAAGQPLEGESLAQAPTVGALATRLRAQLNRPVSRTTHIEKTSREGDSVSVPPPVRSLARKLLQGSQHEFFDRVMQTKVIGRTFIPYNRATLVVANHSSHLDQGLVKYALGTYGKDMATLAAQDYFFEGNKYRKAYFEQLTNLVPMSRNGSLRSALRRAGELIDQGRVVLIFPEGTRAGSGGLRPFKPAMGHLALHHSVDILPLWLEGTGRALPKGAKMVKNRELVARIGPPLAISQLREATDGLSAADSARIVARIAHQAVDALSRGSFLKIADVDVAEIRKSETPPAEGLQGVFDELRKRFVPGAIERPISYYFSLGDERWTVHASGVRLEVAKGKTVAQADCVLKTSPQNFEKIVREAWVPQTKDFLSGNLKTNNVAHLLALQKIFRLSVSTAEFASSKSPSDEPEGEG